MSCILNTKKNILSRLSKILDEIVTRLMEFYIIYSNIFSFKKTTKFINSIPIEIQNSKRKKNEDDFITKNVK